MRVGVGPRAMSERTSSGSGLVRLLLLALAPLGVWLAIRLARRRRTVAGQSAGHPPPLVHVPIMQLRPEQNGRAGAELETRSEPAPAVVPSGGPFARRRAASRALLVVGLVMVLLSVGTVAYAQWSEWQGQLQQVAGPEEALPERLEVPASVASSIDGEAAEQPTDTAGRPGANQTVAPASADADGANDASLRPPRSTRFAEPPPISEPSPVETPVALASVQATAPTATPPASASAWAPVPTPVETATPVAARTADEVWQMTLGRVDLAWESNWPEAIAVLTAFLEEFPDQPAAKEKLYGALVSYGEALTRIGHLEEATELLERAQTLVPEPGQAVVAMRALTPTPTPDPVRGPYGRPASINIPRIGVNTSVAEVAAPWGEYLVPAFVVGFHVDSAHVGWPGNSIFNGHLTSINAGRIFARLHELQAGDAVYVYTPTHRLDWVVHGTQVVPNTDHSFIDETDDLRITLYTCAGRFDYLSQDYTHRLVVVGGLVSVNPRS